MPVADARIPGVELAVDYSPALHVGGDVVDVLHLPGGRLGFMLGDVSGKGVSAALVMGLVQGALTASAAELASNEPERALAAVNDLLLRKTSGERFASLFWCTFDPSDATLRYVNAGHPPAFLIRARSGVVERLDDGGPVLGVIPGAPYRSGLTVVAPGDLLVTYSDGIAEAANDRDDEFGLDRIVASVREQATSSARSICDAVLSDVERFATRLDGRDDRTLLVLRFTTECAAFAAGRTAA
jgi:sigma-B regulation protein RsbU (phosphoserine phosphatase)